MRGLAVAVIQSGYVGPDVLDADREENSSRFDRTALVEIQDESLAVRILHGAHLIIDELGAEFFRVGASFRAKVGRPNALRAEEPIDAASFPVAGIAGIDQNDRVQIAGKP